MKAIGDSLETRYNVRPHFEKLFWRHRLRGRTCIFCLGLFVHVIEPIRVRDIDPPTRSIPLLKKVVTSLNKYATDILCKLLVGVWGPGRWCKRVVIANQGRNGVRTVRRSVDLRG